jgi:hypothetical protein
MRATLAIAAAVFALLAAPSATAGVTYTYDMLGRLSVATYDNNKEIDYHYDPAGNRTQVVTLASAPHFGAVQHTRAKAKSSKRKPH